MEEVILERPHALARWTFLLDKDARVLYKDTNADASHDSPKAIEFLHNLKPA